VTTLLILLTKMLTKNHLFFPLKLTLACLRILSLGSIWSSLFFTAICLAINECRVDPPWAVLPPVPLISWGGSGFRDFNGSWKNGLILYFLIFTADEELSLSSNLFFLSDFKYNAFFIYLFWSHPCIPYYFGNFWK